MEVSDDALKLLVAEHGVRGTARLLQMSDTQAETFRKRAYRAGWVREPAIAAIRAKAVDANGGLRASPIVPALSPTAALHAELAAHGARSRTAIARTVTKAAEHFETLDAPSIVADAGNLKSIAQTASIVHSWDRQGGAPKIRLELLANKGEVSAVEIESEVVTDDWADEY